MKEYPNKPIFATKKDSKRLYFTTYANIMSKAVISLNDKNTVIEGNPKITLRIGESEHKDEIILEFLRTGEIVETPKNSDYDSIEIYMPKDKGIEILQNFIDNIKKLNLQ